MYLIGLRSAHVLLQSSIPKFACRNVRKTSKNS